MAHPLICRGFWPSEKLEAKHQVDLHLRHAESKVWLAGRFIEKRLKGMDMPLPEIEATLERALRDVREAMAAQGASRG